MGALGATRNHPGFWKILQGGQQGNLVKMDAYSVARVRSGSLPEKWAAAAHQKKLRSLLKKRSSNTKNEVFCMSTM